GPARLPLGTDHLRLEHQVAAADALVIDERTDVQQALAALNLCLDDPVERSAVEQLGGPRRHHASRVELLGRLARPAALVQAEGDPFLQVLDAIAAHTELDEMKRHVFWMDPYGR